MSFEKRISRIESAQPVVHLTTMEQIAQHKLRSAEFFRRREAGLPDQDDWLAEVWEKYGAVVEEVAREQIKRSQRANSGDSGN